MNKFYVVLCTMLSAFFLPEKHLVAQCTLLNATFTTYESRCAATGAVKVRVTGGSGNYKYKASGPVTTNFTSSDSITGLSAGTYILTINDVVTNCTITRTNVIVAGTYQDPRFTLAKIDVSCDHAANGSIIVDSHSFGRAPFLYTIVAPSPSGIGTNNSSGIFNALIAGDYSVMMTDSCGGIQTRQITITDYSWWIDSYSFTKSGCDEATGFIKVIDSRGNVSTAGGIPGFTYGIVRFPGDTIWSTNPNFTFSMFGHSSFDVVAKDNCGVIKKAAVRLTLVPTVGVAALTYNYLCNTFSASLTAGQNFLTPDFCLFDSSNTLVVCNSSGIFNGIPYGGYCIKAHDACTDTTISRCFRVNAPPVSVGNQVLITNKVCSTFSAAITAQAGLTNPIYCIYDSLDVLISCNSTGIFSNLTYQPYCITTKDGCRDTLIKTCFNVQPPGPTVPEIISPVYITCTNFGIHIGGDSLTLPEYCLYDSAAVLVYCNSTGVFDSIPLGNYCVTVHDACYDTLFTRCLSVLIPVIQNDVITAISRENCAGFTVTATSSNLGNVEYCLYDNSDVLIACDNHGIFANVPYGNYCVKARSICPDTLLIKCFGVFPALPAVGGTVQISALTCSGFSAQILQQQNLNNPSYCLYNDQGNLINCNMTGIFQLIPYGNYCIKITDACYDTTITRCFSQTPIKVSLSGNAGKSCSYGWAQFNLNMGGGIGYLPVNVKIYNPDGSLYSQSAYASNSVLVDSIPGVSAGQYYTIIATDNCGNNDTVMLGSPASYFDHEVTVTPKCPGALWINGSGNIVARIATNMGTLSVKIMKKNGVAYLPALTANTALGGVYTFTDLGPGTYLLSSSENFCNRKVYDTVVIRNYQYPNLDRSSAYQCDVNGFSVSAIATNGVGPFSYQIIGSQPTIPSISTMPQSNPIFSINNGANYSLIRLRALDACGNATLGDASILPLAINGLINSQNCMYEPTTLSVDSIFNSTYTWFKKFDLSSTDSVLLGTGTSYFIPTVLPSDTGVYICYVSVNSGCINRTFNFHIGGNCWVVLPVKLEYFKGQALKNKNLLEWKTSQEEELEAFIIEKQNSAGKFQDVGIVQASKNGLGSRYLFYDVDPGVGKNSYRLRMQNKDHSFSHSDILVMESRAAIQVTVYPNPVRDRFTVNMLSSQDHHYKIGLFNVMGQMVSEWTYTSANNKIDIQRPASLKKGIYLLHVYDEDNKRMSKHKIIFL